MGFHDKVQFQDPELEAEQLASCMLGEHFQQGIHAWYMYVWLWTPSSVVCAFDSELLTDSRHWSTFEVIGWLDDRLVLLVVGLMLF